MWYLIWRVLITSPCSVSLTCSVKTSYKPSTTGKLCLMSYSPQISSITVFGNYGMLIVNFTTCMTLSYIEFWHLPVQCSVSVLFCDVIVIVCCSVEFKDSVSSSASAGAGGAGGASPVVGILLSVTQLCCFPFAVDTNEELLTNIQM